ncbi:MAG: TraB/GumN family protein [Gemmatimonadaceae bacterium]
MLYRVHSATGPTVYLLGSVHLLTAEAGKLPAEVDSAFSHSDIIAFETNLDTIKIRAQELLLRGRYAPGSSLRTSLSPAGLARADTLLRSYGLTVDQMNGFKPWLVSVLLSQMAMQRANFQAQFGVDAQIDARAHAAGKQIIGLESADFQVGMFDRIPPADQERMLTSGHTPDSASKEMARIKDAWLAGNSAALDSLINEGTADSPKMLAMLVTDRNKNWIPKIEDLLNGPCDALVVVGAGHLVGKEGLVELLKAKGYSVKQM